MPSRRRSAHSRRSAGGVAAGPPPATGTSRRSILKLVVGIAIGAGAAGAGWASAARGRRPAGQPSSAKGPLPPGTTTAPARSAGSGSPVPSATASSPAPGTGSGSQPGPAAADLAGVVVGIDPGHNGDNWEDPSAINSLVWNGVEQETCDTTGTQTAEGYTEAQFAFNVAQYLATELEAKGATVVLTRHSNSGVGPCITQRASLVNDARADVALSIHADGGPVTGRGFSILEPVADGINDAVIASSQLLGEHVRAAFLAVTPMPVSDYYGVDGIVSRPDLGGLNLTTVPKVMVECGNMQNPTDAALLVDDGFQQQAAKALATAVSSFLASARAGR